MFEPDLSQYFQEEPDAVTSPHPFDLSQCGWDSFDEYYDEVEGEGGVGDGSVPIAEALDYIPTTAYEGETGETQLVQGYWQSRGKTTARQCVRRFLLYGESKQGRHAITSEQELAQYIDGQVNAAVARQVHMNREWWEKKAAFCMQVVPPPPPKARTVHYNRLKIVSYSFGSAHDRLEQVLHVYASADIIQLQGTRFAKKKAPKEGR